MKTWDFSPPQKLSPTIIDVILTENQKSNKPEYLEKLEMHMKRCKVAEREWVSSLAIKLVGRHLDT